MGAKMSRYRDVRIGHPNNPNLGGSKPTARRFYCSRMNIYTHRHMRYFTTTPTISTRMNQMISSESRKIGGKRLTIGLYFN